MRYIRLLVNFFALLLSVHVQPLQAEKFSITVGVEEVRIDATVLDRKGQQITDLTADDFEIFQDGKRQPITSCVYIMNSQKSAKNTAFAQAAKAERLISTPMLPKNDVRRTIAFLYNRSYEARMAIQKYVETQMETGDLVTIIGGNSGIGALQLFSSDKQELLSRIKNLPIIIDLTPPYLENKLPGYIFTIDASLSNEQRKAIEDRNNNFTLSGLFDHLLYADEAFKLLKTRMASIRYGIRALQDMPGRKYLMLMSSDIFYDGHKRPQETERLLNETANEALRAGVVIFTLDTHGLRVYQQLTSARQYLPLSQKTGGIIVENSNFFLEGIKPVQEALRGYYLLSYIPPPTDSTNNNRSEGYHRIRVKVKRSGSQVHTRDGFFDSSKSPVFAAVSKNNTLKQAMFSPFLHNDLKLSLTSGYAYALNTGYFLRTLMHLDGKDLTFTKGMDGGHSLSLELAALTSDSNGKIPDEKGIQYDFQLNDEDISRIRKEGLDLSTYLPIKNPGDYYVRAAVKDKASGKIGSGYQFLEIPDLSRLQLSLSSIFILNSTDDAAFIRSGSAVRSSNSFDKTLKWRALRKSPARRIFRPGESFDYLAIVYNSIKKGKKAPELEMQTTLFKEGQLYKQDKFEDIRLNGPDDTFGISIIKRQAISENMEEGSYILQLMIRDKQLQKNSRIVVQAIDFQIGEEPVKPQSDLN